MKSTIQLPDKSLVAKTAKRKNRWWRPSILVASIYLFFLVGLTLIHHYSISDYIHIGTFFSHHNPHGTFGYDGQYYYFIARDPWHAYLYMDNAPYRYQRIVYGLLVYMLSLGKTIVVPWMLLLVNFFSIVLSVEIVARLLLKRGLSPWFSLAIGFYFGQSTALIFDTAEPLTIALLCIGLWYLERRCMTRTAVFMGLAALSRETAILFPLVYTLSFLWQRRWSDMLRFLVLAILPLFAWYVVIWFIFGRTGLTYAPAFELMPFSGVYAFVAFPFYFWSLVVFMVIPTMAGCFLATREALGQRWRNGAFFIWVLNLILVMCLSAASYQEYVSSGRISTTLVLGTLLYAWHRKNGIILCVAQYYTWTFPFYALGVMVVPFVPT